MTKVERSDAEWRQQLSPESYRVARQAGTERPFTGEYNDCKRTVSIAASAAVRPFRCWR